MYRVCLIPGCTRRVNSRLLCIKHYPRWKNSGMPPLADWIASGAATAPRPIYRPGPSARTRQIMECKGRVTAPVAAQFFGLSPHTIHIIWGRPDAPDVPTKPASFHPHRRIHPQRCAIRGCTNKEFLLRRGLCRVHYERWRRDRSHCPHFAIWIMSGSPHHVDTGGNPRTFCVLCGDPSFGHNLCMRHYWRYRITGKSVTDWLESLTIDEEMASFQSVI